MKKKIILGCSAIALALSTAWIWDVCPFPDPLDYKVLFPNPEDCNSFFTCNNGVKILTKCPDGLHFNEYLDICDWPWYAGCENGSVSPGGGTFQRWSAEEEDCTTRFTDGTPGETFEIEVGEEHKTLEYDVTGNAKYVVKAGIRRCSSGGTLNSCTDRDCPSVTFIE